MLAPHPHLRIYLTEAEHVVLTYKSTRDQPLSVSFGGGRVWLTWKDGHIESRWALEYIVQQRAAAKAPNSAP